MRSTKRTTGVAARLFPAVGLVWCCICMENTESGIRLRLADVFVSIEDPRQAAKVEHDLVELLVVAVAAVLAGADTFVEIEIWAEEKLDWLRRYLPLVHGIASHDTFGRLFGLIEPGHFEAAFRRWMQGVLPALDAQVVAIDGKTGVPSDRSSSLGWKTSRRSGGVDATELHLVSAFAGGAGVVPGQRATDEKSNEIKAIPELLATLALAGCVVTIDAMGTQTAIAGAIRERGADYVLAVKDNHPRLAESIQDFWRCFVAHPAVHTPHSFTESVEKGHGRLETRVAPPFHGQKRKKLSRMAVATRGESELAAGNAGAVVGMFFMGSQSGGAAWLLRSSSLFQLCTCGRLFSAKSGGGNAAADS